jgi:hypothetical protein
MFFQAHRNPVCTPWQQKKKRARTPTSCCFPLITRIRLTVQSLTFKKKINEKRAMTPPRCCFSSKKQKKLRSFVSLYSVSPSFLGCHYAPLHPSARWQIPCTPFHARRNPTCTPCSKKRGPPGVPIKLLVPTKKREVSPSSLLSSIRAEKVNSSAKAHCSL